MPARFPRQRLLRAGISPTQADTLAAAFTGYTDNGREAFARSVDSRSDAALRRLYGDGAPPVYTPPDPFPQYVLPSELLDPSSDVHAALRAAFVASSVTFHDKLTGRPPGALGSADSGQAWTATGGNPPALTPAGMTLPGDGTGAGYAWADLGVPAGLLAASVTFAAGTTGSVATLLVSKGPGLNLDDLAVHYYFDTDGWTMQVRAGGETPFPILGSGRFATPLVQDGATEYQALVSVRGNTVRIVHADGSTSAFTDTRIADNLSGVVAWEVYRTAPSQAQPVFTRVWAAPQATEPPQLPYATVDDVARVGQGILDALTAEDAAQHTQALTIAADGTLDLGSYRTALVNSSATALTTIRSDLPVGQSITVRPWGGSVTFTPGTGNLAFEGGSLTSGWAQTLTFTRFDFPADGWVLASRTG